MNRQHRRATVLVGTVAVAASMAAGLPAAQSDELVPSRVAVRATDTTPASGEVFRLVGAVWSEGERVPATVRVKTFRNGEWVRLRGAVMQTNRFDRYRIRIVLQMKGERLLRVVGVPADDDIARSRKDITVHVH